MKQTLPIVGCTLLVLLVLVLLAPTWAGTAPLPSGPRPTPTPAPLPPGFSPPTPSGGDEPSANPDLIVEDITTSPINPQVNLSCTIQVTIKNESEASLAFDNNFYVDLYVNPQSTNLEGKRGDVSWGVQGFYMGAFQSYVLTTSWVFTDVVAQNLWAQVDTPTPPDYPRGDVIENDEYNNIMGPHYVRVVTNHRLAQQNHKDFMQGMANTLDVVPVSGTLGLVTSVPGLTLTGDSAMILGVFQEPPSYTWGLSGNSDDYNALWPDILLNSDAITNNQTNPVIAASGDYLVAVWQDGREAPIYGTDIYLSWSEDEGTTWHTPQIVNDDGLTGVLQEHPNVAVADNGDVVVVWQDRRNNSFDIFVQQYQINPGPPATLSLVGGNEEVDTDAGAHDQIYPDIAVDKEGNFYITWQDQRNGNDDVFAVRSVGSGLALDWDDDTLVTDQATAAKQSKPSVDVIMSIVITDVDYVIISLDPPDILVTKIYTKEQPIVVVAWEDWRNGDPDIYIARSIDYAETFGQDIRVNQDAIFGTVGHYDPATAVTMGMERVSLEILVPGLGVVNEEIYIPVAYVHVVWQDYRNTYTYSSGYEVNDPDIYYARFSYVPLPDDISTYIFSFNFEEKVNHTDERAWQVGPVWQGFPEVEGRSFYDPIEDEWEYDIYIVWADGRNYGGEENNYDIYLSLKTNAANGLPEYLENNIVVNDGAKLHNFTPEQDPSYRADNPPPARQLHPSVVATMERSWPEVYVDGGYIFIVWDDDRIDDPFVNRNIYFGRTNTLFINHTPFGAFVPPGGAPGGGYHYGGGTYISPILDTHTYSSTWYIVDWHAWTEDGTYLTLQTRLGDTLTDVLNSDWVPNRNMPTANNWPFPDGVDSIGAPLEGYDAPGQHIIDAAGNTHPRARYIQYKVNMWTKGLGPGDPYPEYGLVKTPQLFDVILHYNTPVYIYLPLILRNYW